MSEPHASVRLYANDFGESRFENLSIPMSRKEFAPPTAPLHVTQLQPPVITSFLSFRLVGVAPIRTRHRDDI